MGCCEVHSAAPYLLSPSSAAAYQSILLKEKKPSQNKKVRFEISYTNYKELRIEEETSPSWLKPEITEVNEWKEFKSNGNVTIRYAEKLQKVLTCATLNLNTPSGHEAIICLINNPKYRLLWDKDLRRVERLMGDPNLDATVGLLEKWEKTVKLYDRTVRKFGEAFYISYVPFGETLKDNFILYEIHSSDKVQIFWNEDVSSELDLELEKKFVWAKKLLEEIIEHNVM